MIDIFACLNLLHLCFKILSFSAFLSVANLNNIKQCFKDEKRGTAIFKIADHTDSLFGLLYFPR
jgi:hypothetical protein